MNDQDRTDQALDQASLTLAIAERSAVSTDDVESVLASFGVTLTDTPSGPRDMRVARLRLMGTKAGTGVVDPGPFDATFHFGSGVTALVTEANLRGKTTVLELITFALRGSPRNLRADVQSWLEQVSLDAIVAGQPIGIRLRFEDKHMAATVLTAATVDRLADAGSDAATESMPEGVHVLSRTTHRDEFAAFMTQFMLDRLGLEPVANWQRHQAGEEDGTTRLQSWPAYFGAIYLPDAGDQMLLGDHPTANLPGRLLQLFCDVPFAATLTRVNAAVRQLEQEQRGQARRADEDAQARAGERAAVAAELRAAQEELADIPADTGDDLSRIMVDLDRAERQLAEARRARREAVSAFAAATSARQEDERAHIDAMETALARRLFHGLTPRHCPRCETAIDPARSQAEREQHLCAVCTTTLDLAAEVPGPDSSEVDAQLGTIDDGETNGDGDEVGSLAARVEALRDAERAAQAALNDANNDVTTAEQEINRLTSEIAERSNSEAYTRRRDLEFTVARLSGALDAMPDADEPHTSDAPLPLRVLRATAQVLDNTTRIAAQEFFSDLNEQIVILGRAFGIDALESVELDRAAHMRVTTAGVRTSFSRLSRGERLRLRVAVLIALLRVGTRRGVGTHPGLILLDSPAAEEVSHEDARRLLAELHDLRADLPDLQIVVATAAPDVVIDVIPEDQIYRATGEDPLW